MSGRLVIVAGLPGAGKSTYLEHYVQGHPHAIVYDDYRGAVLGKVNDPRLNKHYSELLLNLEQGREVLVSDIMFCIPKYRNELIAAVTGVLPAISIDYVFFANKTEICKQNVIKRNRSEETVRRELDLIDEITSQYSTPNIVVEDVYHD
ncbi:MAG: AAA family ATPase [Acidobacteriota bacterium]